MFAHWYKLIFNFNVWCPTFVNPHGHTVLSIPPSLVLPPPAPLLLTAGPLRGPARGPHLVVPRSKIFRFPRVPDRAKGPGDPRGPHSLRRYFENILNDFYWSVYCLEWFRRNLKKILNDSVMSCKRKKLIARKNVCVCWAPLPLFFGVPATC